MTQIQVGDVVAIRGDLRTVFKYDGVRIIGRQCAYTEDQLVNGKYLKHTGHGGIWTGVVKKIDGDMALVGGGWRGIEMYEKIEN